MKCIKADTVNLYKGLLRFFPKKFNKLDNEDKILFLQKPIDLRDCFDCEYYVRADRDEDDVLILSKEGNLSCCSYNPHLMQILCEEPALGALEIKSAEHIFLNSKDIIELYDWLCEDIAYSDCEMNDLVQLPSFIDIALEYWYTKTSQILNRISEGKFKNIKDFEQVLSIRVL